MIVVLDHRFGSPPDLANSCPVDCVTIIKLCLVEVIVCLEVVNPVKAFTVHVFQT